MYESVWELDLAVLRWDEMYSRCGQVGRDAQ